MHYTQELYQRAQKLYKEVEEMVAKKAGNAQAAA